MANTTVTAKFTADTSDITAKMAALNTQLSGMQAKFSTAGAAMMGVGKSLSKGLTLPIVGVGVAAVTAGASFEKSMNKVKAVSGATGDQFTSMSDTAKELGRTTQFSASQAADGMSFLAMAGFEANDIVGAMPGVLNLAAAGQMDLAQSADIASNILTGYGKTAGELDGAVDTLTKTFTSANVDLTMLGESFKYVAPIAKGAGLEFEEVSAAIGLLGNAGIQGSMAGTSLRMVIQKLLSPTGSAATVMERLGINATTTTGDLLPLNEIIAQLASSGATTADMMEIFGARAGPAMAALVSQGADALVNLTDEVSNAGGTAADVAETQMEGFSGSMLRLKSAFEGAMIAIAESGVLDALTKVLEIAANGLSTFTEIWGKIPGPVKTVTMVLGGFSAALGPVLWAGGKAITMLSNMMGSWRKLNARVSGAVRNIGLRLKTLEMDIKTAMIKSQTRMGALGAAANVMSKKVVLAFKTIGTAAKGLLASFGPIGLAMIGVTFAVERFMGAQQEAQQEVDDLTDAMKEQGSVMGELTAKELAKDFQDLAYGFAESRTFASDLDVLGLSMSEVVRVTLEGESAINDFKQRMAEATAGNVDHQMAAANVIATITEQSKVVDEARANFEATNAAQEVGEQVAKDLGYAMGETGNAAEGLAGDFGDLDQEISQANDALAEINEMFSGFDANVAAIRAKDELGAYFRDINEEIAKNNRSLTGNGKAAMKNREAVLTAFNLAKQDAQAWGEANNATLAQVEDRFQRNVDNLRETLIDEGFTEKEIEQFFGSDYVDAAGVTVQGQMTEAIGTMADRVGEAGIREMKGVGEDLMTGLTRGINAGINPMERAMSAALNSAEDAARNTSETGSPSKVFMRIGRDLMEGMKIGVEDNQYWVKDLAQRLTDNFTQTIESGEDDIYGAAKSAFVDWYKEIEADLDRQLEDAQAKFDSFAEGIQNTLMQGIDLGGAYSGQFDEAGAATGVSLLEGFRRQVQGVQWAGNVFQAVKNQAMADGASQEAAHALMMALAAEGPAIGGAIGQQILDEGMAKQMANEYESVLQATRAVGEALMPEHLQIGRDNAAAEHAAWVERMGPGGDLRKNFLTEWRAIGVETSQADYEGMRDAIKEGGPVGDALMNLFKRLGKRSSKSTASKFAREMAGAEGNRMRRAMDTLAASLNRTATVTIYHKNVYEDMKERAMGGPVSARQAYIVGERGPEVFVPGTSGNIIPNHEMPTRPVMTSMNGGNGGGYGNGGNVTNIKVNVNAGMGSDGAEVGRQVVEAIRKYERRSGPVFASA